MSYLVLLKISNIHKVSSNRRRRRHRRANEMGAASTTLPTFEIAVAGRGAALTCSQCITIHSNTHATTSLAPLKTCIAEDIGQSLFLSLPPHLHRARHDPRLHPRRYMLAL